MADWTVLPFHESHCEGISSLHMPCHRHCQQVDGEMGAWFALDVNPILTRDVVDGFENFDTSNDLCTKSSSPASKSDDTLEGALTSTDEMETAEWDGCWRTLPEMVLHLILKRLPIASKHRMRCVCREWKEIYSEIPYSMMITTTPCIILSGSLLRKSQVFCPNEATWYNLPFKPYPPMYSELKWELEDTDAGLALYQWNKNGRLRLCVCNPLTSIVRDISPRIPGLSATPRTAGFFLNPCKAKLLVDPIKKTFEVVLLIPRRHSALVYDSATSNWTIFDFNWNRPPWYIPQLLLQSSRDFFVLKNVLYVHNVGQKRNGNQPVGTLDMNSGQWARVEAEFPRQPGLPMENVILADNNGRVLLFQFSHRPGFPFLIWELLNDDGESDVLNFSLSNWTQIDFGLRGAMDTLLDTGNWNRFADVHLASEHICFMFCSNKMGKNDRRSKRGLRYSFAYRTWSVIPCPRLPGKSHNMHTWEPNSEMNPA